MANVDVIDWDPQEGGHSRQEMRARRRMRLRADFVAHEPIVQLEKWRELHVQEGVRSYVEAEPNPGRVISQQVDIEDGHAHSLRLTMVSAVVLIAYFSFMAGFSSIIFLAPAIILLLLLVGAAFVSNPRTWYRS